MEIVITVIVFLAFTAFREYTHQKHIKDLELKLITKTPTEYAAFKAIDEPKKEEPKEENTSDDLVDALEVSPEEGLRAITRKD